MWTLGDANKNYQWLLKMLLYNARKYSNCQLHSESHASKQLAILVMPSSKLLCHTTLGDANKNVIQ